MNATDYTMDPRNAIAVRFLQSRPIQIGTSGFLHSVAMHLDNTGYLSKSQRESLEGIAAKSGWEPVESLPPSVDDRGERVLVYLTPVCPPGPDFMAALSARYKPAGKTGIRCVHDPVYKHVIDPAPRRGDLHRLGTSRGYFEIPGTGWNDVGSKAPRNIDPENAANLNEHIAPLLSTPDSIYRFRSAKVRTTWWVFGQRPARDSAEAQCA
jgi:hypothetical protein